MSRVEKVEELVKLKGECVNSLHDFVPSSFTSGKKGTGARRETNHPAATAQDRP